MFSFSSIISCSCPLFLVFSLFFFLEIHCFSYLEKTWLTEKKTYSVFQALPWTMLVIKELGGLGLAPFHFILYCSRIFLSYGTLWIKSRHNSVFQLSSTALLVLCPCFLTFETHLTMSSLSDDFSWRTAWKMENFPALKLLPIDLKLSMILKPGVLLRDKHIAYKLSELQLTSSSRYILVSSSVSR